MGEQHAREDGEELDDEKHLALGMVGRPGFRVAFQYLHGGEDLRAVERVHDEQNARMHPDEGGEYFLLFDEAMVPVAVGIEVEGEGQVEDHDRNHDRDMEAPFPVKMIGGQHQNIARPCRNECSGNEGVFALHGLPFRGWRNESGSFRFSCPRSSTAAFP